MKKEGSMTVLNKVSIVDRVTSKLENACAIIIDIIDTSMVKNTTRTSDEEVMSQYLNEYRTQIVDAKARWAEGELLRRGES